MMFEKDIPQCTYSNKPIRQCPYPYKSIHWCRYSYKSNLCVGVTILPDLVIYPPAVPEVLPGAFFGGAVLSDPGLAAVLSFCEFYVWLTGPG